MRSFATVLIAVVAGHLASPEGAWAVAALRGIETGEGGRIDLQFDGPVDARRIKTEYFRDIIQVSIDGVSVYPARIMSVASGNLSKVFAYQYTPRQIRCRLTVRGDAEKYEGRVKVTAHGRSVAIRVEAPRAETDSVTVKAAQAIRAAPGGVAAKSKAPAPVPAARLTGGKDLPSPFSGFAWLGALVLLAGASWVIARKLRGRGAKRAMAPMSRISGLIGDFTKRAFGGKAGMIEIVSTHHLSPRQSIAVVDVGGRRLVLGITQEAISLITRLDADGSARAPEPEVEEPEAIAEPAPTSASAAAGQSIFSDLLATEKTRPASGGGGGSLDRIRRKMEGYKTI